MKKISRVLVLTMVLAVLLLPSQLYALQAQGLACSRNLCSDCLKDGPDLCCSKSETITKSKVIRGRAGMVELVNERVTRPGMQKCASLVPIAR